MEFIKNESQSNDHNAAITQLVECMAVNHDVTGSSPVGGVYYLLGGL